MEKQYTAEEIHMMIGELNTRLAQYKPVEQQMPVKPKTLTEHWGIKPEKVVSAEEKNVIRVIGDIDPTESIYDGIWEQIVKAFPDKMIHPSNINIAIECFYRGQQSVRK